MLLTFVNTPTGCSLFLYVKLFIFEIGMEKLLLYIIEVIVADSRCTIERALDGANGAQWYIGLNHDCLFILDKYDLCMLRGYILENPLCVDEVARERFAHLFCSTLETL